MDTQTDQLLWPYIEVDITSLTHGVDNKVIVEKKFDGKL